MTPGLIFWFTGLSGSGKSTVAAAVKARLERDGIRTLILDGDDVRERLHRHLGFSEADIRENNRLIADLCAEMREAHDVVMVPIISPFASSRAEARRRLGDGFHEIWFSADLDCVAKRDVKGLYARARRNEIDNLIGYSPNSGYEAPAHPDFVVDSGREDAAQSVDRFHDFIRAALASRGGDSRHGPRRPDEPASPCRPASKSAT